MKIAVRGGHNFQAKGASALIDETIEDRKVYKSVIENLKLAGHNVLDVTPSNCDVDTDLYLGVKKAEEWGADLFISIHFDKAYDTYAGALGTATWIYGTGGQAEVFAKRIVDSVANGTGLKNRGVRVNSKLYELRKTTMPAVIVEVCFCEATEDVRIYEEKGANLVGKLIAEGICNNSIENTVEETRPNVEPSKPSKYFSTNARTLVALDPRDNPSDNYSDLGEIYKDERFRVLAEVCDKGDFLPIVYWKDSLNRESEKVWVRSKQDYMMIDTYHRVVNVITRLYARYEPSSDSATMGYVRNGERLYVHRTEGNYALATYFAGNGYKTAWFTAKYLERI